MLLLRTVEQHDVVDVVAVFGVGLVGSSIVRAFGPLLESSSSMPLSWVDPQAQRAEIAHIEAAVREALERNPSARLSFVWSAGRAGFSVAELDTAAELESFRRVLEPFERLADKGTGSEPLFVHISSAGALFEGQRLVVRDSEPLPRRSYGELKLRQERILEACVERARRQILRLPSVFDYVRGAQRRGLIPTMITNGLRQRVTEVSGRPTTLREYVWGRDVGRFVQRLITRPERDLADHPLVLASGRPVSLMRIKQTVERVQKRRIYVRYQMKGSNIEDTTFSPSLTPRGWNPTDIDVAIRKVYADTLTQKRA